MRRRDFTKLALAGAAGTIAAPAIVKAETTFNWKMTSFYGPNAYFYSTGPGSAKDLAKRIEEMSAGRIKISVLRRRRTDPGQRRLRRRVVRHGRDELRQFLFLDRQDLRRAIFHRRAVRLNFVGLNGWIYDGGGLELWREVYDKFNLVPFLCGNTGVQMTGWFRKPIEKVVRPQGPENAHPGPCRPGLSLARRRRACCWRPATSSPRSSAA